MSALSKSNSAYPDNRHFDESIAESLRRASPSSGDNLRGFELDLEYALTASGWFESVQIRRTGDPKNMLQADCIVMSTKQLGDSLDNTLIELICTRIGYRHFVRYQRVIGEEATLVRFVTRTGETKHDICVTGSIYVRHQSATHIGD